MLLHVFNRLNQLQKVMAGDSEQLAHIVQLDLRDTGLSVLDVRPLCKLELLHCGRNFLSVLRVSGHALKSLHTAHNGTNEVHVLSKVRLLMFAIPARVLCVVFSELKQLEVTPVPENVTSLDLSWYEDSFAVLIATRDVQVLVLSCTIAVFFFFEGTN